MKYRVIFDNYHGLMWVTETHGFKLHESIKDKTTYFQRTRYLNNRKNSLLNRTIQRLSANIFGKTSK